MGTIRYKTLRWAAPVALVAVAGLAACGDSEAAVTARTVSPGAAAVGSDVHLENLAGDIAAPGSVTIGSDVHLENLAGDIAAPGSVTVGSDVHLENLAGDVGSRVSTEAGVDTATAEQVDRDAHLEGNKSTYSAPPADDDEPGEFVPGSRRMPTR